MVKDRNHGGKNCVCSSSDMSGARKNAARLTMVLIWNLLRYNRVRALISLACFLALQRSSLVGRKNSPKGFLIRNFISFTYSVLNNSKGVICDKEGDNIRNKFTTITLNIHGCVRKIKRSHINEMLTPEFCNSQSEGWIERYYDF